MELQHRESACHPGNVSRISERSLSHSLAMQQPLSCHHCTSSSRELRWQIATGPPPGHPPPLPQMAARKAHHTHLVLLTLPHCHSLAQQEHSQQQHPGPHRRQSPVTLHCSSLFGPFFCFRPTFRAFHHGNNLATTSPTRTHITSLPALLIL